MAWLSYLVLAVACVYMAYETWRYFRRRPVVRITAEQLKERIDRGEHPAIADIRSWQQVMQTGDTLPGARVASASDLLRDLRAGTLNGEVILYCS